MEWPKTKDDARSAGLKYYRTGAPCKHGHRVERLVSTGACAECNRAHSRRGMKRYIDKNREALNAKAREAYWVDPETARAKSKQYRDNDLVRWQEYERHYAEENSEHLRERAKANRLANIERFLEWDRAWAAKWRDANRARYRSYGRRRHAVKLQATPAWLTDGQNEAMVTIYEQAERLARETGILHEVDHIIPLNHPDVCGLHVPWNLQVLSLPENRSKSNSFDGTLDNDGWRV